MLPPETQARISLLRVKASEGTLTLEEMQEAVQLLREGRIGAAITSARSKSKAAAKKIKTADELLNELGF
jgi:hypothetical protein